MIVSRLKVFAVLPVINDPIPTEDVAWRYADRFNDRGEPTEELAREIKSAVARALRRLRSIHKAEGPPWRRA